MVSMIVAGGLPSNTTFETVPDWKNADLNKLREDLDMVEWPNVLHDLNAVESWEMFKGKVKQVEANAVPSKRRRVKSRPLWMQQNVIRVIRKRKSDFGKHTSEHKSMRNT